MSKKRNTQTTHWHEQRRIKAWQLHQQGLSQVEIATTLGVTQGAVSQWVKRAREGGVEALYRKIAPGRHRALTDEQLAQIPSLLDKGAKEYGFQDVQWTTRTVAELLNQVFGVSHHPAHVSRILNRYCPDWRSRGNPREDSDS